MKTAKKILCAGVLLCGAWAAQAVDAVYQWSVEVPDVVSKETGEHPRAYLWIPETCERLKGVVVGNDNMLEETLFGHADFRKCLAAADVAIVFVQSGFQGLNVKCDRDDAEIVFKTLARLGEESGYDELGEVPVAALGHSAWADWPYFMAFVAPERMFAAVSLKGSWPHMKPFKENFAERLNGVPTLLVGDEYSNCAKFLADNAAYYETQTNGCFKIVCDWGAGHFDYTPELPGMLGAYLRECKGGAAKAAPKGSCAAKAAPPLRDKTTALMGFKTKAGEVIEQNPKYHLQITIPWEPEEDGKTFTLDPVYLDIVPPGRPEGWTGKKAGEAVTHPADPAAIEVDIVQGSGVKLAKNRFALKFDRRGFKGYRARELVIKAVSPAQDEFKRSVQQAILRFPLKVREGEVENPNGWFVREGAATVDDAGNVTWLTLPPRAKTPHVATLCRYRREPNGETVYQYCTLKAPSAPQAMPYEVPFEKQVRVILCMDTANEVDDALAIVHALLTPQFDVKGIVAEHFRTKEPNSLEKSVAETERVLGKMWGDAGGSGVPPLLRGAAGPMADEAVPIDSEGARFIVAEAMKPDPRPLYVCCGGPLTDVASAILIEPAITNRMTVTWSGGGAYPSGGGEYNWSSDPKSVNVVFVSCVPVWQFPNNVYSQVRVTTARLAVGMRPRGEIGRYLFDTMMAFNLKMRHQRGWPRGEDWTDGDAPFIGALLDPGRRTNDWEMRPAPRVDEKSGRYIFSSSGETPLPPALSAALK